MTARVTAAPGRIPATAPPTRFRRPRNRPPAHGGRSARRRTVRRNRPRRPWDRRPRSKACDSRKGDRRSAHGAGLQRDIEVAIGQPLAADDFGGLPDRKDFRMRGRVAVGQGPVPGGRDHLLVAHDHAADRHFAGFSGLFGSFQRQIHERCCGHVSYCLDNSATKCVFSKSGYRFCESMRLKTTSAHALLFALHLK